MIGEDKRIEPDRFYCRYDQLEEFHAGMWRAVTSEAQSITLMALAVRLLRDTERFAAALDRVLREWPLSCRAEFTRDGNRLAWFGQAACCIVHGVPESLTRRAWWKLSEPERAAANAIAAVALTRWDGWRSDLPLLAWVQP
jgi:hypothetical protein